MTTPCIITMAITGSLSRKKDSPNVPISVAEQVESTQQAFEAGATLVHPTEESGLFRPLKGSPNPGAH